MHDRDRHGSARSPAAADPAAALVSRLAARFTLQGLEHRGAAVALVGEPGAGKTWTAERLRRRLTVRSITVPAVAPDDRLIAALPGAPRWAAAALGTASATGPRRAPDRADAVVAALATAAPVVLVVEDVHDGGPDRSRFWQAVAERVAGGRGVGLVATSRTLPPHPFDAHALIGLDEQGTRALVRDELGADVPAAALAWLTERACGNPLFTLEHLRFLVRRGHLWSSGHGWQWRPPQEDRIPSSLEALIAHHLASSVGDPWVRDVSKARALLPPNASVDTWSRVAGVPSASLGLARVELERVGVLRGGDFVHPLYREVERLHLSEDERRAFAGRAVAALEPDDPEAAAALVDDARLDPARAVPLLRRAAAAAATHGRDLRAATFLAEVAERSVGREGVAAALEAARLWREHDPVRAGALAERVLDDDPYEVEATFLLAEALMRQGRPERARRLIESVPEANRTPRWTLRHVELLAEANDFTGALERWHAQPGIHELADASVRAQVVRALDYTGNAEAALALADDGLARSGESARDRAVLFHARCRVLYNAGRVLESEQAAGLAIDLATHARMPLELARALSSRATIRDTLGRYADALEDAEASLAIFGRLGLARDHAQQQARLACLVLETGDHDRAERLLLEGRDVMRRSAPSHHLALCEFNLAYLHLERSAPYSGPLALKHAHAGLAHARGLDSPLILAQTAFMAARAEALHGSAERALALADEATREAERHGGSHDLAWCTWARGFALEALGRPLEATAAFQAAATRLHEDGLTLWASRLELEADRVRGDATAAAAKLRRFEDEALGNWAGVVRRYFPQLAEGPAPRPTVRRDVRIDVLGPLRVSVDGRPKPYRASMGRTLLALLVDARLAGRGDVHQQVLQSALYPQMDEARAASALQQLVYRVRGALASELVQRTAEGYALGEIACDAEAFLVDRDPRAWRGTYLQDVEVDGCDAAPALYYALATAASARLDADPAAAAGAARVLLAHEPYDVAHHRLLLRALQRTGAHAELRHAFERARASLDEVGEALPTDVRTFLEGLDAATR